MEQVELKFGHNNGRLIEVYDGAEFVEVPWVRNVGQSVRIYEVDEKPLTLAEDPRLAFGIERYARTERTSQQGLAVFDLLTT